MMRQLQPIAFGIFLISVPVTVLLNVMNILMGMPFHIAM